MSVEKQPSSLDLNSVIDKQVADNLAKSATAAREAATENYSTTGNAYGDGAQVDHSINNPSLVVSGEKSEESTAPSPSFSHSMFASTLGFLGGLFARHKEEEKAKEHAAAMALTQREGTTTTITTDLTAMSVPLAAVTPAPAPAVISTGSTVPLALSPIYTKPQSTTTGYHDLVLNNPGNIRGNDDWIGRTGVTANGYITFDTPENGLRAMAISLRNQEDKHSYNTIEKILTPYASAKEGANHQLYVKDVSAWMSEMMGTPIGPNTGLNLHDARTLNALMVSITRQEKGVEAIQSLYTPTRIQHAVAIALSDQPDHNPNLAIASGSTNGVTVNGVMLYSPLQGATYETSAFNSHEKGIHDHGHEGVDLHATTGTPIYAAGNGRIKRTLPTALSGGYGNKVEISHGNTVETDYGHLSRYVVREGQEVKAGDLIGYAGATGHVTAAHLHYEVRVSGTPVDPMKFTNSSTKLAGNNYSTLSGKANYRDALHVGVPTDPSPQHPPGQPVHVAMAEPGPRPRG